MVVHLMSGKRTKKMIPSPGRASNRIYMQQGQISKVVELREEAENARQIEVVRHLRKIMEGGDEKANVQALPGELHCGDRVKLHGLVSKAGQRLNGKLGTISRYDSQRDRVGVEVDGVGLRVVKADNLA